jgi:hypothetical protein
MLQRTSDRVIGGARHGNTEWEGALGVVYMWAVTLAQHSASRVTRALGR